ncbi:MAG: putative transposase [Paenibacillus sp.]|nr:putative transposase [Paenibacillus sp.]
MIRHYGVYSRRTKKLTRKLVTAWQKEARRWIVKAKRTLRQTWSEKVKKRTGEDPMVCPKCECYYVQGRGLSGERRTRSKVCSMYEYKGSAREDD